MIRYTTKTKDILGFIGTYSFATIKIIANIFYKNNKNGKEQARVVLQKLVDNGDIIKWRVDNSSEFIYQFTKAKVSDHKMYLIKLYSELYKLTDEVVYFRLEEQWNESRRRSDAHIIFKVGEIIKCYLVEFDKFHCTDKNKYDEIYDSMEVHNWYKNNVNASIFPDIIIIDSSESTKVESNRDYKVICLDYNFTDLLTKVVLS